MRKAVFITATDTEVGKTVIASAPHGLRDNAYQ
jgi:dethiobiotin synthetase